MAGFVSIPKPRGGERVLTVLQAEADRRYRDTVAAVAPVVERSLGPEVAANRVARPDLRFRPARSEWRAFVAARRALLEHAGVVVLSDVADCYGSITAARVERTLLQLGAMAGATAEVRRVLGRFADHDVHGLPVGPAASAVLANAVLAGVDAALRAAGFRHVRWVDDVWVAAEDEAQARRALATLQRSLDRLGLRINESKTSVRKPWEVAGLDMPEASARTAGNSGW